MIENRNFPKILDHISFINLERSRKFKTAVCQNLVIIYNEFYAFFFSDIVNEERLDVWVLDRHARKQTYSLTSLVRNHLNLDECRNVRSEIRSKILHMPEECEINCKEKMVDIYFYTDFISNVLEGLDDGSVSIDPKSLHDVGEWNLKQWESCMK